MSGNGHQERTLVLIKPDGVRRALIGKIVGRFERAGLKVSALRMTAPTRKMAETHYDYDDIAGRHSEAIWRQLVEYIAGRPVVAAVLEGDGVINVVRKMCGSTEPASAPPGTIRGDYCHVGYGLANRTGSAVRNVVHASADPADAEREIPIWFRPEEILTFERADSADQVG